MTEKNQQVSEKTGTQRRKLIQKARKKMKKSQVRLAKAYENTKSTGSGLGAYMRENEQQMELDMNNHISMGQNRKMKKKMKKLKKKMAGHNNANDKIFKEMQKYKQSIIKNHEKTIFNPVSQLKKRREKRMKKMQQNARNSKKQILQKVNK